MQYSTEEYLERLWARSHKRKFTVLCGDQWGDEGKGVIEAALMPFHKACVRVAGGANTGRTRFVIGLDGKLHKLVFHLVPTGWADHILSIIGGWELIDLERLIAEIAEIKAVIGEPKADLHISKKAPVFMPYHVLLEQWVEYHRGCHGAKPTGRGISTMLAGIDLRIGPRIGHLAHPDLVRRYVQAFYDSFSPIFSEMERIGGFAFSAPNPEDEVERLLQFAESIKGYVADTEVILHGLAHTNTPTLFGLTQGSGLHSEGTYPFNSATHSIAQSAAYCSGLPMRCFGPVIMVSKLFPTRVGAGPFPTHWWEREAAELFPKEYPELFTELKEFNPVIRGQFLADLRERINADEASLVDKAKYFMVLGNELGATTKRGREIGGPDLHETRWACHMNGVDSVVLTRVDMLSGLKLDLPVCMNYVLDGQPVPPMVYPTPAEVLDSVQFERVHIPLDLRDDDLTGLGQFEELPECMQGLIHFYEQHLGVPVSLSTSAGTDGKIFRLD